MREAETLALTPTRVSVGPRHRVSLLWDEVAAVDLVSVGRNTYVRIKTTGGLAARAFDDLALPAGKFVGTDQFVMASVARYVDRPDRHGKIGTKAELERLLRKR